MTSITPRVRCGLPTNPREWLLGKKKSPWKGATNLKSLVTPAEEPSANDINAKSPIIEGEFEDLIECYSGIDEHYWPKSSSIPSLETLSLQDPRSRKLSEKINSYSSDRSSLVSEGSNASSVLSSASGKGERRKRRIFPGIFVPGAPELVPLSINPSPSSSSNSSNLSQKSVHELRGKHTLYPPSSTRNTREHELCLRDKLNNDHTKLKVSSRCGFSDPRLPKLPNTALREAETTTTSTIAEESNYWDELEVLEEYSTTKEEEDEPPRRRRSREKDSEGYSTKSHQSDAQMKFNMMVSVSSQQKFINNSTINQDDARYNSDSLFPYNPPLSANSDHSRYSVDSS